MVPRNIVVEDYGVYERVDPRRFDALLDYEGGILQDEPREVSEVAVCIAEDGEVDVVEVDERGRGVTTFGYFYDLKYIHLLHVLSLHFSQGSLVVGVALLPHVLDLSLEQFELLVDRSEENLVIFRRDSYILYCSVSTWQLCVSSRITFSKLLRRFLWCGSRQSWKCFLM